MEDSYFLYIASGKTFNYKQFGCCERAGSWFRDNRSTLIYEFIDINLIKDPILSNPDIIEEYLTLISEFLDIPITRVSNPPASTISMAPSSITGITEKEYNERYVCFQIGKYLSNKHFVAMHTLIRYLWFADLSYQLVINAVVNIRRLSPTLPIQDVFAIAHSFQEKTNRALTGKNQYQRFGFMYFKEKEHYLKELKADNNFNTVFDGHEVIVIPKIKIKGNFFDETEVVFDSKQFISFLTTLETSTPLISGKMYDNVIDSYSKHKHIFEHVAKSMTSPLLSKHRVLKCELTVNGDTLENIDFAITNGITGRNKMAIFKNSDELKEFLTKIEEK